MASKVLTASDLLDIIIGYLHGRSDVYSLCQCNHTFYRLALHHLFYDIAADLYKIHLLAESMKSNSLLASHCRRLSITSEGGTFFEPQQLRADEMDDSSSEDSDFDDPDFNPLFVQRKLGRLLDYVVIQCLSNGRLRHLSCNIRPHSGRVIPVTFWKQLSLSSQALRSISINCEWEEDTDIFVSFFAIFQSKVC